LQDIKDAWNKEAARMFFVEKVTTTSNTIVGPASVLGLTALTASNVYKSIVDDRAALVAGGARPNVLLVTPATYALLLQSDEFVRASDLAFGVAVSGQLGQISGLNVFETQSLVAGLDVNTDGAETLRDAEYYMYDADAFSIITNVEVLRIQDSELFNGTKAQAEIVTGYKLTNPDRALIKLVASA
jgi:hypothetical protein